MDHRLGRVGVITDAHANLPATVAALSSLDAFECDLIIHCGDAIGIGPHPREVLDLFRSRPDIVCLMGNHDELFAFDMLRQPPAWLSEGELEHQRWTHSQLPTEWRDDVKKWPYSIDLAIGNSTVQLQHYAVKDCGFGPVSRENLPAELDLIFKPETDLVIYGHHHPRSDVTGRARFINPGALGTNPVEGARFALIEAEANQPATVQLLSAPYDADPVRADLIDRAVPESDFILRVFLED